MAVAAASILGTRAWAASACNAERDLTGLGVAVRGTDLVVDGVDAGSAAARAGFRAGDVVLQVNATVPSTCAHWERAVTGAREDALAVLVLVLRGGAEVGLVLGAGTWVPPAVASAPAGAGAARREPGPTPVAPGAPPEAPAGGPTGSPEPGQPAPPPVVRPGAAKAPAASAPARRRSLPPPPPPLPADVSVSVEAVVAGLGHLAPPDDPPTDLTAYRVQVLQVRREIETLAARNAAPADQIAALRRAARHYEAAEIAWDAIEGDRERERRSRHLPMAENAAVPYFDDTPVAAAIDEFDFLDATVARRPTGGPLGIQASGAWRPVWARLLLWERGAREVDALRAGAGGAVPVAAP